MRDITIELFSAIEEKIQNKSVDHMLGMQKLDLLRCLQTYRLYPDIEVLLTKRPDMVENLNDLYKLWRIFDKHSNEELADLAMEIIQDL